MHELFQHYYCTKQLWNIISLRCFTTIYCQIEVEIWVNKRGEICTQCNWMGAVTILLGFFGCSYLKKVFSLLQSQRHKRPQPWIPLSCGRFQLHFDCLRSFISSSKPFRKLASSPLAFCFFFGFLFDIYVLILKTKILFSRSKFYQKPSKTKLETYVWLYL